jgi:glycosyltransferase involved in cell wall biosynthesis
MTTISFVLPWFGPDLPGGAEAEARRTIARLQAAGTPVEVLTTGTRDLYADWGKNYHPAGVSQVNGITVRRFPVESRDRQAFDRLNVRLMNNLPIGRDDERVFLEQMIRAPQLTEFIRREAADRLYVYLPYMFSTTYAGILAAPERSVLIPCLHDESYARLAIYQEMFAAARAQVYHTAAEQALADRLFAAPPEQIRVVLGEGVNTDQQADAAHFRRTFGLDGPFVLYAGRREAGKNTPLLLDYWARYWGTEGRARGVKLVLIGPGEVTIPPTAAEGIVDLGFVSAQEKTDAYAAAAVFCLPSVNESFSIVLMESWLAGTPALVHAGCAVTVEHARRANGGLYFAGYDEFAATLTYLLDNPATAEQMGLQGRAYVLANYRWDVIIPRYQALLAKVDGA